jgi:hypothetical protein
MEVGKKEMNEVGTHIRTHCRNVMGLRWGNPSF